MNEELTLEVLKQAVAKQAAAFRLNTRLCPAGGGGTKVFPPTHSGGIYAWEKRRVTGQEEPVMTVLLDSVQSQANRMEQALLAACHNKKLSLPILAVDFSKEDGLKDIGEITTLDAPHRIADAIFRDSLITDGNEKDKKFRESAIGQSFGLANIRNATALFKYCPHALVFGVWDSTGSAGGLGNKFQRAVVSEIVGFWAEKGVRTSSRIDPIISKSVPIFETPDGNWTALEEEAITKDDKAVKYGNDGKPSEANLGNVTPDLARFNPKQDKKPIKTLYETIDIGDPLPGGVTIDHALHTWVLSLPALRRLRFPKEGKETPEGNTTARTVLAALALAAVAHLREDGYDLRSRCLLIPEGSPDFELIANDGVITKYSLNAVQADDLLAKAVAASDLKWNIGKILLKPEKRLADLVRKSRESTTGD